MNLNRVIGHSQLTHQFKGIIQKNNIPHAQIFYGPNGNGSLALAIGFVRALFCRENNMGEACNQCSTCQRINEFKHPDFHITFPVVQSVAKISDMLIDSWRTITSQGLYFKLSDWLDLIDEKGRNPIISVEESKEILKKMQLKSYEGGYKVVMVWMAEHMNLECSNKLLKLIEEPPSKTIFILVAVELEKVLSTILSRTQKVFVPYPDNQSILNHLVEINGMPQQEAHSIMEYIQGDLSLLHNEKFSLSKNKKFFELFSTLMRVCYKKDVNNMMDWAKSISAETKDNQKQFIDYCLRMVRESMRFNYLGKSNIKVMEEEALFLEKFAPFICEKNIKEFLQLFDSSHYEIDRNANGEILFTQLCFQTMRYIHKN